MTMTCLVDSCFDLNVARSQVCFMILRRSCFSELWLFSASIVTINELRKDNEELDEDHLFNLLAVCLQQHHPVQDSCSLDGMRYGYKAQ